MFLRWLAVLLLLLGGSRPAFGASAEVNAFNKAARHFSLEFWEGAAQEFGAFITNYPTSFRVPEAVLFRGEALIKARKFDEAILLLSASRERAGELGDLYLFWMGQAHLENTNFAAAAGTFGQLVNFYPDSTNRLEAAVSQAAALARMEKWAEVSALLQNRDSFFQRAALGGVKNDWIVRGYLLLGEAELALGKPERAAIVIEMLQNQSLVGELAWQRWHLQTRIEVATQRPDQALGTATNLMAQAASIGSSRLRAESAILTGSILEKLRRPAEAIGVYQQNLTNNVPAPLQRTALLKIADLSPRPADAVRRLEDFLREYPQTEAADLVLLTAGELRLKQAAAGNEVDTNTLLQAQTQFDGVISQFRDSDLIGKAHLGRGWCFWYLKDYSAAAEAFRLAVERLPQSEDQAVARFKLADAQFSAGSFEVALTTYRDLVSTFSTHPGVRQSLLEQALYQTIRTALAITNLTEAEQAVRQMLAWYPNGLRGDRCLLLVAEGYAQENNPARARELLEDFETQFGAGTNALLPEVKLAVARSFEKEGKWLAAIASYEAWIGAFTNHPRLPEARFARAWDTAMSGATTNALQLFQAFIAAHPEHELAPRARWWIGDFYFRLREYGKAEENYPYTTNYAGSDLFYLAHLRAGAAAMARLSYKDAISYFTTLISDPKCPADLKVKAAIGAGDAYMARNEPGATNRLADLEEAAGQFNFVLRLFPTNTFATMALGRLGDCYKEMGAANPRFYDRAAEVYGRVIAATNATDGVRRQARVALGILAEARAEGKAGAEQQALQKEALAHYADAFVFEDVQMNDPADLFWYQKAGLETARMAELLGNWKQALNVYRSLQSLPNMSAAFQATLERRRMKALEQANGNGRAEF